MIVDVDCVPAEHPTSPVVVENPRLESVTFQLWKLCDCTFPTDVQPENVLREFPIAVIGGLQSDTKSVLVSTGEQMH